MGKDEKHPTLVPHPLWLLDLIDHFQGLSCPLSGLGGWMSLKDSLCHRVALNVGSRSTNVSPLLLVLPWGTATTHHLLPLRSHARCSWGMCACVYVCCVCVCACTCTCICECIQMCAHLNTHVSMHVYKCVCACNCVRACRQISVRVHVCVSVHVHKCVCMCRGE